MFTNRSNKNAYFLREEYPIESNQKKWDERFFLEKIPPYDAFKDVNYLSLGLMKSKIKYENLLEKEKHKKYKFRNPISEHYVLDSQPKKTFLNTKLIFTINDSQEKNKNDETKRSHSLTYKHRLNNSKNLLLKNSINNNNKNIDPKSKTNYISDSISNNKLTVEETDLLEEFEIIKIMWNKFGVTKKYQENFVNFLNSLDKKESIKQFLVLEKKQMQKFKYDLTLLLKKIIHRNDEINNLKNLVQLYINILNEKKFYHEKKTENLESLSAKNEEKVISDLKDSLLSVRINTINVVNQIKNFSLANSYYFYMNKIDLSRLKNDYYYNDEYLLSIKNDLDFVQNSAMQNLYDFDYFGGGDPFFLSFTQLSAEDDKHESNKEKNERKLPINDKMLTEIQNCLFFLNQAQICFETKISNNNKNKIFKFLNSNNNNANISEKNNIVDYGIGSVFKGNLERNIIKLKMQEGYDKLFTFVPNKNNSIGNSEKKNVKKKIHNMPLMTSQQLKERFNEYESINSLIYEKENNKDNKEKKDKKKEDKEDEYRKRDKEIMFQKIKDLEKEMKQKEKEKKEKEEKEEKEKEEKEKEKEEKEKEEKEKKEKEEKEKKEELKKSKNEEEEYEGELDQIKKEEKEEENQSKKLEEEKKNELKIIEEEKIRKEEEKEKEKKENKSKLEDEIKEEEIREEELKEEEEEKPEYIINWFTGSLEELTPLYNDYLSSIPQSMKDSYIFPEKANDFLKGIYPKVIIAKEKKEANTQICGICGVNYYINSSNKLILNISHISAKNTNKEIIINFLELIETNLDFKTIEFEFKKKDELYEILIDKGFKEDNDNEDKKILRKEYITQADNKNIIPQIKYDSLSVLTLVNKNDNSKKNCKAYTCFDNIINKINLSLLINILKNDDKYKIEVLNSSKETSLIDKFSKIDDIDFDFIKLKNNNCLNIGEATNKELFPEENNFYAVINNSLNIQINTLMSYNIDNYLYNGIEINSNNIIQETKYKNNLYNIKTLDKNVNIILYQYNDLFEKDCLNYKNNIYTKFIELFKETINILKMNEKEENNEKKILWIPSFNINTNLFSSKISINKDINIKNEENNDMMMKEYNEFLKINYLPDKHVDKNIKINLENKDNIFIKDKFIIGICHKEFMEKLNIPIISLVNVTCENFIKS